MPLKLDQVISDVVCWRRPCPNRGRRPTNYRDTIEKGHSTGYRGLAKSNKQQTGAVW